eukprot:scaffold3586_cov404-Prasinococcus_capsulatus_cf.AAC.16
MENRSFTDGIMQGLMKDMEQYLDQAKSKVTAAPAACHTDIELEHQKAVLTKEIADVELQEQQKQIAQSTTCPWA